MAQLSHIAALAFASSLALLATGCDRNKTTGEANTSGDQVADARHEGSMGSTASSMGDTIERKADQAGQAIDDSAITTAIKGKYLVDDTLKGGDISVETSHGVVTLTGAVQSAAARELAQQIAQGVDGVASVNNSLQVSQGSTARK